MSNKFRRVARALANLEYDFNLDNASPEFCLHLLENPNLKMLTKMHRKLRTSSKEWIIDFIQLRGLFSLLQSVDRFCKTHKNNTGLFNSLYLAKLVCCIKELLNLKYGMECIIDMANDDSSRVNMLAKGSSWDIAIFSQILILILILTLDLKPVWIQIKLLKRKFSKYFRPLPCTPKMDIPYV